MQGSNKSSLAISQPRKTSPQAAGVAGKEKVADESAPIVTTVPESVSIDTGADSKQIGDLNAEFADFWKQEDAKEPTDAPPAPAQGAAQETKSDKAETLAPPKAEPKAQPETKPEPKPEPIKPEARQFTDTEIDQMRPGAEGDFKKLKGFWMADRARMKSMEEQVGQLTKQLNEAQTNAWTPEQKADYEHAASIRRRFDLASDPEFIGRYRIPIQQRFETVLEEAVNALPDRPSAQEWANVIRSNYRPDQLDRQWWLHSVIEKVPNEVERQALLGSVTELLKLQRDEQGELNRHAADKSAFDNFIQEKASTTAQRVQQEIMAEISEQEKKIAEVLPRDVAQAKTPEERVSIEAHNERFKNLNDHFLKTMQDISKNGPRGWVRASVEATRAILLQQEYDKVSKELDETKTERDQLRTELDKIAGARRKLSQTSGTPPASSQKKEGLSIKDLDVRKSFERYDWGST